MQFAFEQSGRKAIRKLGLVLVTVLVSALSLVAQVTVGDDLRMHLQGDFGFSYGGSYGTYGSGHGTGFVGNGNLSGSYYDPRFISFQILPYYNRGQDSGTIGFINDSEGITATTNIFSGSRFPGAITYSKSWSSGSAYGVPGASVFTSDSNARTFLVNWSLLFPNKPTLTVNYNNNASSSSVVNESDLTSHTRDLNLNSQYRWRGFDINGGADFIKQNSSVPLFLGTSYEESTSNSQYYQVQAGHALPLSGTFNIGYAYSKYRFDGTDSNGSSFFAGAGINPTNRLSIGAGIRYNGNQLGQLQRDLFGSQLLVPIQNNSSSISYDASASYIFFRGFSANAFAGRIQQTYNDREEARNYYGGSATYMNSIPFLGFFRFSFVLMDFYNNLQDNNAFGTFNLNGSLSRKFGKWETGIDAAYGQSVITKGSWATTSAYSYGGNFLRKMTPTTMIYGSYRAGRSAITLVDGNKNHTQTGTFGFNSGRFGASGSWSQSSGNYVLTPAGIFTPTPLAGLITNQFASYDARGWGASASVYLFRGATVTGGWDQNHSETDALLFSRNEGNSSYLRLRYKVRKLVIWGTYRRMEQTISASGAPAHDANSFSIQITRYFNVF